jgi:hypothetical protein
LVGFFIAKAKKPQRFDHHERHELHEKFKVISSAFLSCIWCISRLQIQDRHILAEIDLWRKGITKARKGESAKIERLRAVAQDWNEPVFPSLQPEPRLCPGLGGE